MTFLLNLFPSYVMVNPKKNNGTIQTRNINSNYTSEGDRKWKENLAHQGIGEYATTGLLAEH